MSILWRSEDIVAATGGTLLGQSFTATGLSIDTRTLQAGELYIAIQGNKMDGHDFVPQAFEAGAAGVLVDRHSERSVCVGEESQEIRSPREQGSLAQDDNYVLVKDTVQAMRDMAAYARNRSDAVRIGITGSVGKTSTKEMLAACFAAIGRTHAAKGSFNNHWGVPYTLAGMPQDTEFGVFEMGMNHAGEITPLATLVKPHIAVITTIASVHIEHFENEAGIAAAKAEIFNGMAAGGIAILNADNPHFNFLRARAEDKGLTVRSFGTDEGCDAQMISCELHNGLSHIEARIMGEPVSLRLKLLGHHMAKNALAALLAVACASSETPAQAGAHSSNGSQPSLGLQKAINALQCITPLKGRGEQTLIPFDGGEIRILDESYNASPVSVAAGLAVLGSFEGNRKIAVLGDMYELGSAAAEAHRDLVPVLRDHGVAKVFTCGQLMKNLYDGLPEDMHGFHTEDHNDMASRIAKHLKPGDVVFVKGSRGPHEKPRMQYTVDALKGA